MQVTTTTLEMLAAPPAEPRPLPEGVRVDRALAVSPEYARFLYGLVGGPWFWTDRLWWSREQWEEELAVPGTEFWIPYGGGVPLGYLQLQPVVHEGGTHVEVRYFGIVDSAIGNGLGGSLLERGVRAAWSLPERIPSLHLPEVSRVWVHTCSLDGPAAIANYQARGFEICDVKTTEESHPDEPLGSWASTGGPVAAWDY